MFSKIKNIYDANFNMFIALGLGRIQNGSNHKIYLYSIYRWIIRLIYIILCALYFYDAYSVRNISAKLIVNMSSTVLTVTTFIKLCFIDLKYDLLIKIRKNFNTNFNLLHIGKSEEEKRISKKNMSHFLRLAKCLHAIFGYVAGLHFILPIVLYLSKKIKKYPLPVPPSFGDSSPVYEIIYVAQVLILVHFVLYLTTMDLITYEFEIRIADNFEILIQNLNEIKKINDKSDYTARETLKILRKNIKHHQNILNQMDDINKVFSFPLFLQLFLGALKTSVIMFNAMIVSFKKNYCTVHILNGFSFVKI